MADLTPDEQQFFATGELPASLAAEHAMQPNVHALSNESPAPAADSAPTTSAPTATPATDTAPAPSVPVSTDALEILTQRLNALQAESAALRQQLAQPPQAPQQAEQVPDPDHDPLGHMTYQLNKVSKTLADMQAQQAQQTTQQQQLAQLQAFQKQVGELRDQFMKTTPDFQDAYAHLREGRMADLRAIGMSDQQIQASLYQDELQIASAAIERGINPAQAIYEMAKRHGYTAKVSAPPQDAEAKLAAVAAAQAAAKQLPATPVTENLTLESLKNASEADINRIVQDNKLWQSINGNSSDDIFLR